MANGDLSKRAANIATRRGWEVVRTLDASPDRLRVLVYGPTLPFDAVLCLRADAPGSEQAVGREASARRDAGSEHVVGLLEVVDPPGGARTPPLPALLVEQTPGGTLAELLARADGLRPHEASTVLVGVASGLAALHRAGWAHTAVSSLTVAFRRDGCPALDGLDCVQELGPRHADRDRDAFQRLVEVVCASVPSPVSWQMLTAASAALAREDWDAVVAGIVGVAEPGALEPGRLAVAAAADPSRAAAPVRRRVPSSLLATVLDGNPAAELVDRIRIALSRRRRLLLVLAAPLIVGAVVLAAVPPRGEPRGMPTTPSPHPSAGSARAPAAGSGASGTTGVAPSAADDDPVSAAPELLEKRFRCFTAAERSPDCLADVLQSGGPAVATELSALATSEAAERRDFRGAAMSLVQRWGDAALVACTPDPALTPETKPASFLLVRNEAGWRIRDVFGD